MPFSRLDNGKIYQRAFGGQSQNFGGAQAARTCAAADRTGHAMLHTLYQQNIRRQHPFLRRVLRARPDPRRRGRTCSAHWRMEIETGEPLLIEAKTTLLATGGCGQVFRTTTNALINTGDGMAMALRAGMPLQDMEFLQFHPTGIAGKGMLITEGVRGEGGYLLNKDGERFMERYAPNAKDLASRDVVSRSIVTEVKEGRGCGPERRPRAAQGRPPGRGDDRQAPARHPRERPIFANVDPAEEPIPVFPTAHYMMGGIPTNRYGQVVVPCEAPARTRCFRACMPPANAPACRCTAPTAWAAIRCSTSWCSAAPPATTSSTTLKEQLAPPRRWTRPASSSAMARLTRWEQDRRGRIGARPARRVPQGDGGPRRRVPHRGDHGRGRRTKCESIRERLNDVRLADQSKVFNTARIEALELENLIDVGMAIAIVGTAPHGKPRRPFAPRLPEARRPELDEAQPVLPGRRPPGLQAGADQAADGRELPAQGTGLLTGQSNAQCGMRNCSASLCDEPFSNNPRRSRCAVPTSSFCIC